MRQLRFLTALGSAVLAAVLWIVPAFAVTEDLVLGEIGFTMLDGSGNVIWNGDYAGHSSGDPNVFDIYDGSATAPGVVTITWEGVSFDIDPGVSGNWAITNNDPVNTLVFSLIVDLPVLPVAPSSLMSGSTSISIADANFDGSAALSTVGVTAMYNGRIDLAPVTPTTDLFGAPFTLMAPPGGTASSTASFGVFPGTVPGPAVGGFIGIQHVFSLSPGDRATFNSTFHLVAVPEPTTLLLLGGGLAGVAFFVRRRA
jgi:hypothetical protein